MESKLRTLMADVLSLREDAVTADLAMHNVDSWDSLRHVELVTQIEDLFNIQLTSDEIPEMISFPKIMEILAAKGSGS